MIAALTISTLIEVQAAAAAPPPVGKTYFILSLGMASDRAEAYELDAGCLRFTKGGMCEVDEVDGDCGDWWYLEDEPRARKQKAMGFAFDLFDDETGLPIRIEGRGRIDSRGPRSSIGGVGEAVETTSGVKINFAIAGRAVGAARCERLVADFTAAQGRQR
jgi:hypothetical protein